MMTGFKYPNSLELCVVLLGGVWGAKLLTLTITHVCIRISQLIPNKSDISYLKTSRAFDVLIHSVKPNSVG